jgi:hypothetical protein
MNPSFDGVTRKGEQQVIPIRGGVYRQWWEAPLAADATVIEDEVALSTVSVTVPLSYTMDFPRNVQVDFGGTTTDVNAGTVSVQGTNVLDETISENLTVIENQSTASVGAKAFKTVTQVLFHGQDGTGATASIGIGSKLGLDKRLQYNTIGGNAGVGTGLVHETLSATRESVAPTVVIDPIDIEKNTITFNTALANTKTYIADMITTDPARPRT